MAGEPLADWQRFVAEAQTTGGLPPAPISEVVTPTPLPGALPGPPSFDVIEILPERAQGHLRKLRDRSADAHAVCVRFSDIQELSTERVTAENRLRALQAHPSEGGHNLPLTDSRVVTQQRLVNKLTDDFRRLKERDETKAAAFRAASQALANVESWLKSGVPGGTTLEPVEVEPPTLNKNETITDAIERLRRRVRELKADLHRISSSPFPSIYCKQRAREMVEQLAQRGTPDVTNLIEHDREIGWQTQRLKSEVFAEQRLLAFAEVPDTVALFAWLHRDLLIKRLDAEIDTESDDSCALTHEQRQQAEAEVMADLLSVERDEGFFV